MAAIDLHAFLALYRGANGAFCPLMAPVMAALTFLGSGWSALALVPMSWHAPTRRFARALAAGIAVQAVLVWSMKRAIGRVRPWIALGLPPPIGAPHDASFPSGHAAGSFCVAAFLVFALPAVRPASPRLCRVSAVSVVVLAALIGLSRVYLGAHFPGDVVAGAVLGTAVGAAAAGTYAASERRRAPIRGREAWPLEPPTEKG
jgi:membrane-associated phospholipid phosphatase